MNILEKFKKLKLTVWIIVWSIVFIPLVIYAVIHNREILPAFLPLVFMVGAFISVPLLDMSEEDREKQINENILTMIFFAPYLLIGEILKLSFEMFEKILKIIAFVGEVASGLFVLAIYLGLISAVIIGIGYLIGIGIGFSLN